MTKEIIIDGVNVAGCCFYNNGKCDNPNGMACNCINNAVCYFKELKHLEQENERLKEEIYIARENYGLEMEFQMMYREALEEIREMVNKPCVPSENDCLTCPTSCFTKDILIKINEALK